MTGNSTVDQLYKLERDGKIDLTGSLIPDAWRHTLLNERGRPDYLIPELNR